MLEGINLLPEILSRARRVRKQETRLFKGVLIALIILLVLVLSSFYLKVTTTLKLNRLQTEINQQLEIINEKKNVEGVFKVIKLKLASLNNHFKTQFFYSIFLRNLEDHKEEGVYLTSVEVGEGRTVRLTGVCQSFEQLSNFLDTLELGFLKGYKFTDIRLLSLGKDFKMGSLSFSIEFAIKG